MSAPPAVRPAAAQVRAVRWRVRSATALVLVSVVGVIAFCWPFLAQPGSTAVAHAADAPWVFALLLPLVLAVVLAEVADGSLDAKAVAMLGVLAAVGTALRPLGAGVAGLEPIWLVIVLGGRALGPGFGFSLGSLTLLSSALVTGGVGPWLPFQMLAAGWVGFGAGALPQLRGRAEVLMVAVYGGVAAIAYGFVMNLWFWPFTAGLATSISFVPGAPVVENLQHWLVFSLATGLGYDVPRGILTGVLVLVAGPPVLLALRRATRRAAFDVPVVFEPDRR